MRSLLVLSIFAFGTLLSLRGVGFAACLFMWNNIFQPLWFARNPWMFPAAKYVLGVMIAAYIIHWARGQFKPKPNFMVWFMAAMLGWIFLATKNSVYPHAMEGYIDIVKYMLPLVLITTCLRSIGDIKILAAVLVFSVGIWSAQAGVHGLIKGVSRDMSIPGGQMTDNNDFMAATVSILPMLVYFMTSYRGRFWKYARMACIGILVLSLCAIVFSNSRGTALGLAGTLLLYVVFVSRRKFRDGAVIFGILGVVLLLLPDTFWARMSTIEMGVQQTEGSAAERMKIMTYAFYAIFDYPVFGVGPNCWADKAEQLCGLRLDPHNLWLKLTVEIGVPGLVLYLLGVGTTLFRLNRIRYKAAALKDTDSSGLATGLIIAVIGFLLPSTFLSHPFSEWLWTWIAVGNAFIVVYSEHARRKERKPAGAGKARRRRAPWAVPRVPEAGSLPGGTAGGPEPAPA